MSDIVPNNDCFYVLGQTLKVAGLWLRTDVFTHGQLYVACSRVGKPDALKFAVNQEVGGGSQKLPNVVFKEVLLP